MIRSKINALAAALCFVMFCVTATASAQQKVLLEIKAKKGAAMKYDVSLGGTLNLDLNELPIPRSTVKVENMKGAVEGSFFFTTLSVQDKTYTYDVKGIVDRLVLGGLLKLDGLGIKSTDIAPKITLTLDSTGKVQNLDMAALSLPGGKKGGLGKGIPGMDMLGGMGMGGDAFNQILAGAIGMLPELFPAEAVAPGDTWVKEIDFNKMGIGGLLPNIPFNFKLVSVTNGVANIEFTTKGTFDGSFLKNFLSLLPEIPMGEDVFKITDINLLVDWDGSGTMKLALDSGRVDDASMSTNFQITLGAKTNFKHTDNSKEDWAPDGKINVTVDVGMKYAGAPTAAEIKEKFQGEEEQPAPKTTPKPKPKPKGKGKGKSS